MRRRSEPITAVDDPPGKEEYREGGGDSPPQREQKIGEQAEDREDHPEYFFLHWECLRRTLPPGRCNITQVSEAELVVG